MAQRHIHYEAAFEDFVRSRGWPYVAVDEQKKAIFAGSRVKSFDFLVYRPGQTAWLVDVKGRKFPYHTKTGKRYWENWVTREDLEGLTAWGKVFGDDFQAVFVFVYHVEQVPQSAWKGDLHHFRNQSYGMLWIPARDYAAQSKTRSPSWDTVDMPAKSFREMVRPVLEV